MNGAAAFWRRLKAQGNSLGYILCHPMNRDRRVTALLRWAGWQLGCIIDRGERTVSFVDQARLAVWPGMTGATQNIYCGLADYSEMAFLLHMLKPNELFVDVGANVGVYTVLAAAAAGADVLSIEPQDGEFSALQRNIAINGAQPRVRALKAVASAEDGEAWLSEARGPETRVARTEAERRVHVKAVALDTVLKHRSATLIKIDVEGYEAEVLKGAARTLADPHLRALLVEVNGSQEVVAMLGQYGFKPITYEPTTRQVVKLAAVDPAATNTIFVRDIGQIVALVKSAPLFMTAAGRI